MKSFSNLRRWKSDGAGATAVEFAILALPFFLIVFTLLQTAVIYVVDLSFSYEAQSIARIIRTGRAGEQGITASSVRDLLCKKVLSLIDCSRIAVDLRTYGRFGDIPTTLPITNGALDRGSFSFEAAPASTIMALRVYYELPVVGVTEGVLSNMSNGRYLVSSVSVFKTEPF